MECCPHCESKEGFYGKYQYRGSGIVRFNYDGSETENGNMYDRLNTKESKYAYCLNCHKRLFEMSDITQFKRSK